MKRCLKIAVRIIGILMLLIFLTNIIEPAFHKTVSKEQKEKIAAIEYAAAGNGTERIACIDDNEEALLWRLRMINAARERIIFVTFDFRADESGTDIMAALYMAACRGVKVQILVDGIYQILYLKDSAVFQALCAHENVEAGFYNVPNAKNIWRANYRMHDKYILIDEQMYLLGGRNTNDIFLGDYKEQKNIDREIFVYESGDTVGDSFRELQDYFYKIWGDECVRKAKANSGKSWEREYEILEKRYEDLNRSYELPDGYDRWYEETVPADKITLIQNGWKAERKEPLILAHLEDLILNGKDTIIQTPYVICNHEMYDVLKKANQSSKVSIILNAVEKGSNPWGCTDYLNNKEKIRETGATVYELMNGQAVHTKTVVIDDHISIVGSYNLDMRSTYLDTELMLVIDCEELNAHIREMCAAYEEKSIRVLPDGTETAGPEYKPVELPWKKKVFYGIIRIMIRPFRHLL